MLYIKAPWYHSKQWSYPLGPWRHYPHAAVWENTTWSSGGSLRLCGSCQTSSSSAERQSDDQRRLDQRRRLWDSYDRGEEHCLIHLILLCQCKQFMMLINNHSVSTAGPFGGEAAWDVQTYVRAAALGWEMPPTHRHRSGQRKAQTRRLHEQKRWFHQPAGAGEREVRRRINQFSQHCAWFQSNVLKKWTKTRGSFSCRDKMKRDITKLIWSKTVHLISLRYYCSFYI